jgi:NAD(P)-dependent dehydrogenase (short-subunit alcohol dehydrogenase family)
MMARGAGAPFHGRVALVTGGASGIGRATAEELAAGGATVAVADVDGEAASAVARALEGSGGRALAVQLDVTDAAGAESALAYVSHALGPPAILVNCAGCWTFGRFEELATHEWQRDLQVNLVGTLNVTRAALAGLRAAASSAVVNVASDAARVGEPGLAVYSAAKAGVIAFSKSLAKEAGRHGVRVNCVAPASVRTPATADHLDSIDERALLRAYPLGRLGEPGDVAGAIAFLASDEARWITGQVLSVNGGYAMPD